MSLRLRLNLLITLLFIALFIMSSFFILNNARKSVEREVESTANFALQLINIAISATENEHEADKMINLFNNLSNLEDIRHINIEFKNQNHLPVKQNINNPASDINAPAWFIKLVKPPETELRRWLFSPVISPISIIIRAEPGDEVEENWIETKSLLVLLFLFICLANILVYFVIGRYLSPLEMISVALSDVEKGRFNLELPEFRLPEINQIAQRFNHMTKVLLKSREENQKLTQRLLHIQEEERRNLAHELHDELGQTITGIKAVAVAIGANEQQSTEELKANVGTILSYSDHMYAAAKNMIHQLRPTVLDELGLIKALQNMIDDWNSRQDEVFCHFEFSNLPHNLEEMTKITIYRIIQESLTNVLKYANASEIQVLLDYLTIDSEMITLSIEDNGVGAKMDNLVPGFGLLGMKERVEILNGKIEFVTKPNQGFCIFIKLPIHVETESE